MSCMASGLRKGPSNPIALMTIWASRQSVSLSSKRRKRESIGKRNANGSSVGARSGMLASSRRERTTASVRCLPSPRLRGNMVPSSFSVAWLVRAELDGQWLVAGLFASRQKVVGGRLAGAGPCVRRRVGTALASCFSFARHLPRGGAAGLLTRLPCFHTDYAHNSATIGEGLRRGQAARSP